MVYVADGQCVDIEREVANQINKLRLAGEISPFVWSTELAQVARQLSVKRAMGFPEQSKRGEWHILANLIEESGYSGDYWGKITRGHKGLEVRIAEVIDEWLEDPIFKFLVSRGLYNDFGVGCARNDNWQYYTIVAGMRDNESVSGGRGEDG